MLNIFTRIGNSDGSFSFKNQLLSVIGTLSYNPLKRIIRKSTDEVNIYSLK